MISLDNYDPKQGGWIGFDLDGTLAHHEGYKGRLHIGAPIRPMLWLVQALLKEGAKIKIVTARVAPPEFCDGIHNDEVRATIEDWCEKHIGQELEITCMKDKDMYCLVDDRVIQVEKNTGRMYE